MASITQILKILKSFNTVAQKKYVVEVKCTSISEEVLKVAK
jgi:hypothetical protein